MHISKKIILKKILICLPSLVLIFISALFSFKLWHSVMATTPWIPITPPTTGPETPPGVILGAPQPTSPDGIYYSSINTYLNIYAGTFHTFYTTNGDEPDSLSQEYIGEPITINYSEGSAVRLKAISYDGTGAASNISETDYVFDSAPITTDITNISNLIDSLVFTPINVDTHPYPDTWKILFLSLSNVNTPTIQTSLSPDQINNIRYRVNLFEDFVEESVPTLDLQINFVDVQNEVLTNTDNCYGNSPCFYKNDINQILEENNSDEYDGVIVVANMGNIDLSYGGLTWSSERFSMLPYAENMAENGYLYAHAGMIHEWLHQVEYWFPNSVSPEFITPNLHDNSVYGYYDNGGVEWLNWYQAYLSNNLTGGPSTGINREWWRYTPTNNLKPTDGGSTNPPATQVNVDTTITVTNSLGTTNAVFLPEFTRITRSDNTLFEPSALTANEVSFSAISGLDSNTTLEGALQWGIVNQGLVFSNPITISIFVGTDLNGQTLNIVRSVNGSTGWSNDGIVSPGTCVISNGYCQFQATKASYYAVTKPISSGNNNSPSSNNSAPGPYDPYYCGDLPPSSNPNLFQIDTTSTTAKLFFTPLSDASDFYVSFSSVNSNAEEHGGRISLAKEGVQSYTVYQLKPNTVYYFKVRGQRGCMPGGWSNILKIKTTSSRSSVKKYYVNSLTTITNSIGSVIKKVTSKSTSSSKPKVVLPSASTNSKVTPTDKIISPLSTPIVYPTSRPEPTSSYVAPSPKTYSEPAPTPPAKKKCFLWWCW